MCHLVIYLLVLLLIVTGFVGVDIGRVQIVKATEGRIEKAISSIYTLLFLSSTTLPYFCFKIFFFYLLLLLFLTAAKETAKSVPHREGSSLCV